jgi:hypothetical protein
VQGDLRRPRATCSTTPLATTCGKAAIVFHPEALLTTEELTKPRTPGELTQWVEAKCRLFADHREAREWVLLRQGLSKKFHEEIYPLYRFVTHLYGGRTDIRCIPNLDDSDFDATILDYSVSPSCKLKVEITSAIDGYGEHLRMRYFLTHGEVNAYGAVSHSGTKRRGHRIHVENEAINHSDHLQRAFRLIRCAVERKSASADKSRRYGHGYVLVIAFDDWGWFNTSRDMEIMKDFMGKHVLTLPLNFSDLYVVGLSGKTFAHFEVPNTGDPLGTSRPVP